MTSSANETQVAGTHYRSPVQHWDFAVAYFGIGYLKGQVTKYLCRWRKKGGVQDLEKAAHFLRKLIEVSESDLPQLNKITVASFIAANNIPTEEAEIIRIVTLGGDSLQNAEAKLAALIAAEPSRNYVQQK